jgi:RNA polymerase primary sigma factor
LDVVCSRRSNAGNHLKIAAPDVHGRQSGLNKPEIKFIPNEAFDSTTEVDFEAVDVELYAAEEGRSGPVDRNEAATTFIQAIEESRILTFEGEQFLFKRLNFLRFRANALQSTLGGKRPKKVIREIERLLQGAQETREDITRANMRLVMSIARKFSSGPDDFDEYVSEANGILLNAIDKFDFARGYRFSTYATHAVQRHLYRFIERASKRKVREKLATESVEAMAAESSDDTGPSADDVLLAAEAVLERLDDVLDERERIIVRGRFGLNESEQISTLRELAAQLGLSKERVRQLQLSALEKLAEVAQPFESTFAT